MTATDYIEKEITPVKGGVVWSPHHYIFSRGYSHVHTILKVEKKKRGGEWNFLLTVRTKAPSGNIVNKSHKVWLDEID